MAALALAVGLASSAHAGPIDDAQLVADVNSGTANSSPEQLTRVGDQIFFVADGPDGTELFVSDGTTAGTSQVANINPGAATATRTRSPHSMASSTSAPTTAPTPSSGSPTAPPPAPSSAT